jgi:hypothetical protein
MMRDTIDHNTPDSEMDSDMLAAMKFLRRHNRPITIENMAKTRMLAGYDGYEIEAWMAVNIGHKEEQS